jgi:hypothetical protein
LRSQMRTDVADRTVGSGFSRTYSLATSKSGATSS